MRLQQTAAILLISTLATSAETDDKETRNLSVPKQPLAMDRSMGTDTTDIAIPADTGLIPWWPENLIVAPIPSSEPVFGWGLNMFAGLFLDLDKQHPELHLHPSA